MSSSAATTVFRTCPLCEATCGLELTVSNGAVRSIRGDSDDVFSAGFICPKGTTLGHLHDDPDRLRGPLVRRDGELRAAAWEEAFAEVARRLPQIIERHGRDAVAVYVGNPTVHNLSGTLYSRVLLRALGTRNVYTASTVDQRPKEISSALMFGTMLSHAVPDLDRTSYLLLLGANPLASNGSLATAPDWPGRLRRIRERGGAVVVVDPNRTHTAERASEHVAIRPGSDAQFLMAMVHTLFAERLVDLGGSGEFVAGVEVVEGSARRATVARRSSGAGAAACAGCRSPSASSRSPASPRRSRPLATVGCARWSRSPATRRCRPPTAAACSDRSPRSSCWCASPSTSTRRRAPRTCSCRRRARSRAGTTTSRSTCSRCATSPTTRHRCSPWSPGSSTSGRSCPSSRWPPRASARTPTRRLRTSWRSARWSGARSRTRTLPSTDTTPTPCSRSWRLAPARSGSSTCCFAPAPTGWRSTRSSRTRTASTSARSSREY